MIAKACIIAGGIFALLALFGVGLFDLGAVKEVALGVCLVVLGLLL